jgi:hypothetical protein
MTTPGVYEVNNIAPSDLNIEFLGSYNRARVAAAKRVARHVCRDKLSAVYINNAFNKFKKGLLYTDPETDEIDGFCIWKPHEEEASNIMQHKTIHILLLCGRNRSLFCNRLFVDLDRYCEEHGIDIIQLEPANKRLKEYYELHGFAATDPFRPHILAKQVRSVVERRARGRGATRRSEARQERRGRSSGKKMGAELTFRKNNRGSMLGPDNVVVL